MTLEEAIKAKKYGDLNTWEELLWYQKYCLKNKDIKSIKEIAEWARRYNSGEKIVLPLRLNGTQLSSEDVEKIFS